ncbi:MAG: hypothetical protein M3347_01935 [Armatimonadota bacterium]|nr:hypothetical protein [Armatimonadota bacterium]
MNWRFLTLVALLLNPVTLASVPADEVAPSTTQELVAGMTLPDYNGVRVADLAPIFTLPDADGKLWSSRDQLNKSALLVFLIGDTIAPRLQGKQLDDSFYEAAEQLHKNGVTAVVIQSGVPKVNLQLAKDFHLVALSDPESELQSFFGSGPTGMRLIAIDKAGFVRRIETVQSPSAVGASMLRIGDPTPRFEVGRPAPDFAVSDMNGRVHRLADLRGQKNLLLTFFPKCFTGG